MTDDDLTRAVLAQQGRVQAALEETAAQAARRRRPTLLSRLTGITSPTGRRITVRYLLRQARQELGWQRHAWRRDSVPADWFSPGFRLMVLRCTTCGATQRNAFARPPRRGCSPYHEATTQERRTRRWWTRRR